MVLSSLPLEGISFASRESRGTAPWASGFTCGAEFADTKSSKPLEGAVGGVGTIPIQRPPKLGQLALLRAEPYSTIQLRALIRDQPLFFPADTTRPYGEQGRVYGGA
jgi:hypothetical protein